MSFDQPHLDQIPRELTSRAQWVGFDVDGDKKTPYVADDPTRKASCTNHETWRAFSVAADGVRQGAYNAVAYALDGDFIGIDLDDCFDQGRLNSFADGIVTRCKSYAEKSISGEGVHILLTGKLPDGKGRRLDGVELYERSRFFICTGNRLPNAPEKITENPAVITWLLGESVTEQSEAIFSPPSSLSAYSVTYPVDELILKTLPKRPGERNLRLLDLARGLRFNTGLVKHPLCELKPVVRRWYEAALHIIRTKDFTETWTDFVYAWERARLPLGVNALSEAWRRSQAEPAPTCAAGYDSEPVRRLMGFCAALASLMPDGRFFLSTHDAARLLKTKPMQIYRWLKMLTADGVIELVQNGNKYRATRFRWIEQIQQ